MFSDLKLFIIFAHLLCIVSLLLLFYFVFWDWETIQANLLGSVEGVADEANAKLQEVLHVQERTMEGEEGEKLPADQSEQSSMNGQQAIRVQMNRTLEVVNEKENENRIEWRSCNTANRCEHIQRGS